MTTTGGPLSIIVEIKSVRDDARTAKGLTLRASSAIGQYALTERNADVQFGRVEGAHGACLTIEFTEARDNAPNSKEAKVVLSGSFLVEGLIAGLSNGSFELSDDQRERLFAHFRPTATS